MAKVSVSTTDKIKAQIDALKGNLTYNEMFEYMLMIANMRNEAIGLTKVELLVIKLLHFGHPRKITQSDLQKITGSNSQTCKKVVEMYANEINLFNKKFN